MIIYSSFKTLFEKVAYGSNPARTFDDLLTICIYSLNTNLKIESLNYKNEYLRITEYYKRNNTFKYLLELISIIVLYSEDNFMFNDLLGEFFQQNITICRNRQFFTQFHINDFMTQIVKGEDTKSMNVLDPACGSGRMLLAFGKQSVIPNYYYGVDIDPLCTKMTTINLFLNRLRGEVICAGALFPDKFSFGYKISFLPFGIFKIDKKEDSVIWQMNQTAFSNVKREKPESDYKPLQLRLF